MILRAVTLAGGLAGAAGLSQFPEYSQQYVQRLGGAVDALEQVVADFDSSAQAEGLTRADALAQMVGTDFIERRRADMENTINRFDTLRTDFETLKAAGPFTRAYNAAGVDGEIAKAAWGDFKPALPLTMEGGVFAGAGFLFGGGIIGALLAFLRSLVGMVFRRYA